VSRPIRFSVALFEIENSATVTIPAISAKTTISERMAVFALRAAVQWHLHGPPLIQAEALPTGPVGCFGACRPGSPTNGVD
jgi:hypothetical protein